MKKSNFFPSGFVWIQPLRNVSKFFVRFTIKVRKISRKPAHSFPCSDHFSEECSDKSHDKEDMSILEAAMLKPLGVRLPEYLSHNVSKNSDRPACAVTTVMHLKNEVVSQRIKMASVYIAILSFVSKPSSWNSFQILEFSSHRQSLFFPLLNIFMHHVKQVYFLCGPLQ